MELTCAIILLTFLITLTKEAASSGGGPTDVPLDTHPMFRESTVWGAKYPMCNPAKNSNLSPIKIYRNKAQLDKHTPTLFVYSGSPIKTYKMNLNFTLSWSENDTFGYHMDLINIKFDDDWKNEAETTYIAGVGDSSYRFFQYMFFLFSKGPAPPGHSVHQIDDETFPMEVVIYFVGKHATEDDTQIHIPVRIVEVENPLFYPVVQAAKTISHRITHFEENLKAAQAQWEYVRDLSATYEAMVARHKTEGIQESIKKLQEANVEVHNYDSSMKAAQNDIAKCEAVKKTLDKSIPELEEAIENTKEILKTLATSLEEKTKEFNELMETDVNAALEVKAKVEEIQTKLQKAEDKLAAEEHQLETNKERRKQNEEKLTDRKAAVESAKESIANAYSSRGFQFKQLYQANDKITALKKLIAEEEELQAQTIKEQKEFVRLYKELKIEERLVWFQASWLLPDVGGHFIYNGSLPVPPCTNRAYTLVMENPIEMSQEQFDAIASIAQPRGQEPLQTCVPPIVETGERQVRYSKKNPQFILDDAVHMKSKKRKQIKKLMRAKGPRYSFTWCTTLSALVFALLNARLI